MRAIAHTVCSDVSGYGNLRWVGASSTGDLDLSAGNVPLGCTSNVQSDLIDSTKIRNEKSGDVSKGIVVT